MIDLVDAIQQIEENTSAEERVLSYAEIILHLRLVRRSVTFGEHATDWKKSIATGLEETVVKDIDKAIIDITAIISTIVK